MIGLGEIVNVYLHTIVEVCDSEHDGANDRERLRRPVLFRRKADLLSPLRQTVTAPCLLGDGRPLYDAFER